MSRAPLHIAQSLAETVGRRLVGRSRRPGWPLLFEVAVGVLRRNFLYASGLSPQAARAFNDELGRAQPFRHAVDRRRETIAGVPVERFTPRAGGAPETTVVYLHGGSYIMGSASTHADLIARLALAGLSVVAVEYRLAPEHRIVDAVADVCAVFRALVAGGLDPRAATLAGDSAGGGLAYLVAIALRDAGAKGGPTPAALATIAPWVDLRCLGPSLEENERYDWGTAAVLREQGRLAAGDTPLDDPSISPAFADLRGLPPSLIHVGEAEIVRDPVIAFGEALRAAGNDVEVKRWPDMVHDFHLLAEFHPMALSAIEHLAAFLRARGARRAP